MKKTLTLLFASVFSLVAWAQDINFEQYFMDEGSLRMDVYQCGTSESSHYVFERFIIEPHFGGSKVNLVDPFNFGTNRVKVIDAQTNTLIYLRGYNTLFRAVMAPSEESGVDIPASHIWVRAILNAHFYTFYIDRYCTTRDYFSVKDVAANAPYDQIYILVNSNQYGGGGFYNFYSMSTAGNMSSSSVIVHEFGHAFAGLADEYEEPDNPLALMYNLNVEPWELLRAEAI